MSGSAIFDLAIGLVFVFLLTSLVCSQVSDKISLWLGWRAKDLEAGLRSYVVGDKPNYLVGGQQVDVVAELYKNPLIKSLVPPQTKVTELLNKTPLKKFVYPGKKPLGIPAKSFVLALMDSVLPNAQGTDTLDTLVKRVEQLPDDLPLKSSLTAILKTTDNKFDTARKNIEDWYDATMQRTTVIYQRNMWGFSFLLGAIIAVLLNVDTTAVASALWRDSTLRATVANSARTVNSIQVSSQDPYAQLASLNLPIGWQVENASGGTRFVPIDWTMRSAAQPVGSGDVIWKLAGWFITAFAAAQGAPFWFDLLRKMTQKPAAPAKE